MAASARSVSKLKPLIVQPSGKHTATVFFLHGSGDVGSGIKEWVDMELPRGFNFPQTRVVFPTAPLRPYIPAMGQLTSVWFQRQQISPFGEEDLETIQESTVDIGQLVDNEIKSGIAPERIIVGGFSMGGSMALYYGMRCGLNLGGIFALSSFLGEKSIVYDDIEEDPRPRPPLLQAHGKMDPLVQYDWGVQTHAKLKQYGVKGVFHSYENLYHELNRKELNVLKSWIEEKLTPL